MSEDLGRVYRHDAIRRLERAIAVINDEGGLVLNRGDYMGGGRKAKPTPRLRDGRVLPRGTHKAIAALLVTVYATPPPAVAETRPLPEEHRP